VEHLTLGQELKDRLMTGARGNLADFQAAALFAGSGALGLWLSAGLSTGTLADMGPGFMPRAFSILLLSIGALTALVGAWSPAETLLPVRLRSLLAVVAGVVGFALIAPVGGIVLSCLWLVGASRAAVHGAPVTETVWLALGLAAASALVFVVGLKVQIPIWPV
jgi:hypothetical protein